VGLAAGAIYGWGVGEGVGYVSVPQIRAVLFGCEEVDGGGRAGRFPGACWFHGRGPVRVECRMLGWGKVVVPGGLRFAACFAGQAVGDARLRRSELHRRFDSEPPTGVDVFTLGMWHWDPPDPPWSPDPPQKASPDDATDGPAVLELLRTAR
jgi:hypothetical protein